MFLSKYSIESVNVRNEIHLALKKKKEFLAIYLEKTELKFGLELAISSLQHVTKRQTGEYWERVWKFLSNQPQIFDPEKSQGFFANINQKLVFTKNEPEVISEPDLKKTSAANFTKKFKPLRLIIGMVFFLSILTVIGFLFLSGKKPDSPTTTAIVNSNNDVKVSVKNLPDNEKAIKASEVSSTSNSNNKNKMRFSGDLLVAPFDEATAKAAQALLAKNLQKKVVEMDDFGNGVMHEMVLIPAGKFMMGESGKDHEVTLTKPFYFGKYEVTQEQWKAVMGYNPGYPIGLKIPVNNISWNDSQDFIVKLNAKTNGGYRLPTEAEWEYTCRAGTKTVYSCGNILTQRDANYGFGSKGNPKPVGEYSPNAFGLFDMHGNVWEWCADWMFDYPKVGVIDPTGPLKGDKRILRGGCFFESDIDPRSFNRYGHKPSHKMPGLGLRLLKSKLD